MARQDVDIGLEGNDGTGDSIRESFRKVNQNFTELYAVFGLGGQISFTSLDDTPNDLTGAEGKALLVNQTGTGIDFYEFVSNAGTNDPSNPNNTISFEVSGNKLIVRAINTKLSTDSAPTITAPFNVGSAAAYNPTVQSLLLNDATIGTLTTAWNTTHGVPNITNDNLLISKGYADLKYVNVAGDTMTGPLNVPAGAVGTQVPRVNEVVQKAGDTMTGSLFLDDHPFPFAGAGSPNSAFDLQAATKFYVDNSAFSSSTNLFVAQNGDDDQLLTPPGKAGRSEAYAYKTIAAACAAAERIQEAAPPDIGPYVQTLTYTESLVVENSYVRSDVTYGYTTAGDQTTVSSLITANKSSVIDNVIAYIDSTYPSFVYDEATCRRDLGLILDSVKLDIEASTTGIKHNYLSRYAGLRYYSNPSGVFAISTNGQYTETAAAILRAKTQLLAALITGGISSGNPWYIAVADRFDDVLDTIDSTTPDPALVEASNYYSLKVHSGANKFTDQSGDPTIPKPNIDIFPGKAIRGKESGAVGLIITYSRGIDTVGAPDYDSLEVQLLTPIKFDDDEELEFGNLVKKDQITIRVETGIYEEQFPIRVPENTSIKGDEFRRAIIRPAPGISTSPHARTYFYRDALIDGLTTATGGDLHVDSTSTTVGYYGYHYLTDPQNPNSTPKRNDEMDVFLMNDATILRNITCQRHGGFMMVLDPTGSIQTRSPYAQTCTSFSGSKNTKAFRGGMYIDGYTYNMPMTIVDKASNFEVDVEAPPTSGLAIRKPRTPSSFFINGKRYQVNAIKNYDPAGLSIDGTSTVATATLILDETSNDNIGFDDMVDSSNGAVDIILQGAGNKSMLANDYTQINDLGYGVICNNNALAELVSVFTYYCHTGYYSRNGSQIRSLTGNNSYGTFGLVSEGSDPDEVAQIGDLEQNLVQPCKIFRVDTEVTVAGDQSALLTFGEQVQQDQLSGVVTGKLAFFVVDGGNTTLYIENVSGGQFNTLDTITEADTSTSIGIPTSIVARNATAKENDVTIYAYDFTDYPLNGSEIEILHDQGDLAGTYQPYDVVSVSRFKVGSPSTDYEIPASLESTFCKSTNAAIRRKVWRLDLSAGVATADTGLQENTLFNTLAVFRSKQNFLLNGVTSDTLTRPSTALIFDENPTFTYRTIAFENTIVDGIPVVGEQSKVTTDDNFNYVDLQVNNTRAGYAVGVNYTVDSTVPAGPAPSGGTTLGETQGDTNIAIEVLDATDQSRVIGMIFTWAGKLHRITAYHSCTDTSGVTGFNGEDFAIISFTDVYNIHPTYAGAGIAARASSTIGDNIALKGGLEAGETYNITVNISTCRATSHDFLDIGTGGYNTSNYPDRIYGSPIVSAVTDEEAIDSNGTNSKAQVQERVRGRVFFASTDQDGFFRVGRFFTVDQGTGRVTFNAALVLTNIDGIGFKRGVRVNEFSPDETFTNALGDTVPTEAAIEGYINRRLGWDRDGDSIPLVDVIGGGALRKSGDTMTGNLSMGGNQINNLATPTTGSDAATKNYVDAAVAARDELSEMQDVAISSPQNGGLLVYNSSTGKWTNEERTVNDTTSDIRVVYSASTLTFQINTGVIENADISASANISQSKLLMNSATTRANATGITQGDLGLASFDSANFTATNGWINITAASITNAQLEGSIANNKLANSSINVTDGVGSTAIALGGTLTFAGTTNEVTVNQSSGTVTIGLPNSVVITENLTVDTNTLYVNSSTNRVGIGTLTPETTLDSRGPITINTTNPFINLYDTDATPTGNTATVVHTAKDTGSNNVIYSEIVSTVVTPTAGATDSTLTFKVRNSGTSVSRMVLGSNVSIPSGNLVPGANSPTDSGQNLGLGTNRWNTVYATTFNGVATEALYADLAENYLGDADYESGTVLIFGGSNEVTVTTQARDRRVAGVVTTNPAHLMNSHLKGDHVVGIALQGRVPCKVLGRVEKGDLLVTSAIPGYAIVDNDPRVGTVIGKAVGVKTDDGRGVVEVVVGRV